MFLLHTCELRMWSIVQLSCLHSIIDYYWYFILGEIKITVVKSWKILLTSITLFYIISFFHYIGKRQRKEIKEIFIPGVFKSCFCFWLLFSLRRLSNRCKQHIQQLHPSTFNSNIYPNRSYFIAHLAVMCICYHFTWIIHCSSESPIKKASTLELPSLF